MNDIYTTIKTIGEGLYTEKRSKFLAFAHHAETVDEAMDIVAKYRKKYFDARHVCYAYIIGHEGNVFRANDDGEPNNTAGKPILGQLQSCGLTNSIIVVVRYYGGINLGTGGLILAYRTAASEAINNATTTEQLVEEVINYSFPYLMMDRVMRVIKELQPRILEQRYDNTCEICLAIRKSEAEQLRKRLAKLSFE